jgi:hypothetical protein
MSCNNYTTFYFFDIDGKSIVKVELPSLQISQRNQAMIARQVVLLTQSKNPIELPIAK